LFWSDRSISEVFSKGNVILSLSHLKLALIGTVIVVALLMSSKGLLPEIPSKPKRPDGLDPNLQKKESHK
jgi:ABC-type branched-subunit amino acid transport system permease subunit